jgi:hypothetical protein
LQFAATRGAYAVIPALCLPQPGANNRMIVDEQDTFTVSPWLPHRAPKGSRGA